MNGCEETSKVVSIGMMVTVVESKVLDGVGIRAGGAEHRNRGAVSPGRESVNPKRGLCVLKRVFVTPLEVKCA